MRSKVDEIITEFHLDNDANDRTRTLAYKYLRRDGKRHRPFLLLAVFLSLSDTHRVKNIVKSAMVAVECIHKASLIHDDIEDSDALRNGYPALHIQTSIPIALNVGDYLAGVGYNLLANNNIENSDKVTIIKILCEVQQRLCIGQGQDLKWKNEKQHITLDELLNIYKDKTSSMFMLSMLTGAVLSGKFTRKIQSALRCSSDALGIAYQIKDDLSDADNSANELSVLNTVSRNCAGKLFYENINQSLKALDKINVPLLKNCIKSMFGSEL